jgi:phosphoribosyl 1,2-cyclic phosphodiesterase
MQIIFLGTGGGRVNVTHRFRSTSGFVIQGSKNIYVDPGPGVVEDAKKHDVKLNKVDVIFVSHPHLDHANDMNVLIEAMTNATQNKKGILLAPQTVISSSKNFGISLSDYHRSLLVNVFVLKPKKKVKLEEFTLTATKAKHDNTKGIGFVLDLDGKRIGYTGDTEYFKGISDEYKDLDLFIINILRADEIWNGHLDKYSALRLIKEAKPKIAILTRFGGEYIRTSAESVAEWIEKESGIRTIASYDGMRFEL